MAAPLRFLLLPSRRLRRLVDGAHALLGVLVVPACGDARWSGLLILALVIHRCLWWREFANDSRAIRAALLDEHDQWWLIGADGHRVAARGQRVSLVLPWLIILPLASEEDARRCCLHLLPDNTSPDDFRRLRVRLLWQRRRG